MRIVFSAHAINDLNEINEYISDVLRNPKSAKLIIEKILKSISLLEMNPKLGMSLSNSINRETNIRYLISGKYIIFYKIRDSIEIVRVLDARRDYMREIFTE